MSTTKYNEVLEANIELHSKVATQYTSNEPHFRIENVKNVRKRFESVWSKIHGQTMLDLGCGTGFMINIAKEFVPKIVGVDATQAMLDRVDLDGATTIILKRADTGQVELDWNTFDIVTAYSFLHHLYALEPTLRTAYKALRPGGIFYADLEPNFFFGEALDNLGDEQYEDIVAREIRKRNYKEDAFKSGVSIEVFRTAEYGKTIKNGFREEELKLQLHSAGFSEVSVFYNWFLGEGAILNGIEAEQQQRIERCSSIGTYLSSILPLSRPLFKYLGFYATK